jgi:hypothetical protein
MNVVKRILRHPIFIRIFNWEYWSFGMVYAWIYPVWIFLCVRARSFFFFSASNPAIENGGFLYESKKRIYEIMPKHLYPATTYFNAGDSAELVLQRLSDEGFFFPLIGKPDTGGRGRGVKILKTNDDVITYTRNAFVDFHIQVFVQYKNEVGIFYYRIPGEEHGKISGIVRKEFLSVTGDGLSNIRTLVMKEKRFLLQISSLEKMYGAYLETVLQKGEEKLLVPYGNHARGAKFLDDSHLADDKLTAVIDNVCRQVKDFYFGRLDIRYDDWEELKEGKNFSVIEVNGAGSEPTHIYDPRHSIFFAWNEIIRHWIILLRISMINHKKGYPYLTWKDGISMFRKDKLHSKKLKEMPE